MDAKKFSVDVIAYVDRKDSRMTNLKLQKTLYYIQGYYSKEYDEALLDQSFEHWPYGPVVPSVYFDYCAFGAEAIEIPETQEAIFKEFCREEKRFIEKIIDKCLTYSASELVHKTHQETPWIKAKKTKIIDFNEIRRYFKTHDPLELNLKK